MLNRIIMFISITILLTGCVAPAKNLINPETLGQVRCASFGAGVLGAPIAAATYNDCINKATVAGFVDLENYERNEGPKVERISGKDIKANKPLWGIGSKWIYKIKNTDIIETYEVQGQTFMDKRPVFIMMVTDNKNSKGTELYITENLESAMRIEAGKKQIWKPPFQDYQWPLEVNKRWDAKSIIESEKGSMDASLHFEVKEYGKITVEAGTFETFYILVRNDLGMRFCELWYSPKVGYIVKKVNYGNTSVTAELIKYNGR
jgi:hypothetical protein